MRKATMVQIRRSGVLTWRSFGRQAVACAAAMTLLCSQAAAQQQSWPLRCRGGGNMLVQIQEEAPHLQVSISFRKASRSAEGSAPGPGECAWIDRPLSANEPSKLVHRSNGTKLTFASYMGPNYRFLVTTDAITTNWLRAVMAGPLFTVYAYSQESDLIVASIPQ